MAGKLQLITSGNQDIFFTENPQFSYFVEKFNKHTNFSKEYITINPDNNPNFDSVVKFNIPQNIGDLLGTISVRIKLSQLPDGIQYIESCGHAIIKHATIIIGGEIIQTIPSDYLQIYSEQNITQTKQRSLKELVGKYPERQVLHLASNDTNIIVSNLYREFIVDIPFYFHNNPELYIPLCALKKHTIEVEITLNNKDRIVVNASDGLMTTPPENMYIENFDLMTETIFIDTCDRMYIEKKKTDYIITQLQTEIFDVDENIQNAKFHLEFQNPVKELYFIIQRHGDDIHPFDYDNDLRFSNEEYILYENLDHLTLDLDGESILTKDTGTVLFLRPVQGTIHHSKTQLLRRFYSYSFAMEPEKWYPTGQINFSSIKDQILNMKLTPSTRSRQVRVYALSYNILRVEDGLARLLF